MEPHIKKKCQEAMKLVKDGNWKAGHDIVDSLSHPMAYRIHGHLHRTEGDDWNADYWYRRAGLTRPALSIEDESHQIMADLGA